MAMITRNLKLLLAWAKWSWAVLNFLLIKIEFYVDSSDEIYTNVLMSYTMPK